MRHSKFDTLIDENPEKRKKKNFGDSFILLWVMSCSFKNSFFSQKCIESYICNSWQYQRLSRWRREKFSVSGEPEGEIQFCFRILHPHHHSNQTSQSHFWASLISVTKHRLLNLITYINTKPLEVSFEHMLFLKVCPVLEHFLSIILLISTFYSAFLSKFSFKCFEFSSKFFFPIEMHWSYIRKKVQVRNPIEIHWKLHFFKPLEERKIFSSRRTRRRISILFSDSSSTLSK